MMKKIFSLMILAMFIVSMVPLTLAEETEGKNWKKVDNDIRRFVMNTDHDSTLTCVGDVQNKFFEFDANRVEHTARYYCSIWANSNKKVGEEKPMLPAYDVKKARILKKRPALVKAVGQFTEGQKNLIGKEFSRARYKWCLENEEDCKETLKKVKTEVDKAKKKISKETKEEAKEKAMEARRRFAKAKELYKEKLEKAKERRSKFLEVRENKDVSEEEKVESAKEYLVEKIELVMRHLDKLKERVESAENMDEERAKAIVERIDGEMVKLEDLIEKTKAAQTKQDIRAIADRLKKIWKGFNPVTKGYAVGLMHAKVNDIIVRSNQLEKKLDSMIESAELRDIDVSVVDEKVDEFSEKIERARQAYAESKEQLQEAWDFRKTLTDATDADVEKYKSLVQYSNDSLKEARQLIKEANELLKEIIKELKEAYNGALPVVEEAEAEEELPEASCVDNDDGRDIFTASFVSGDSGAMVGEFTDFCSDSDAGIGHVDEGTYVHEYFCESGFVVGITKECDNGCSAGACIA
ncbi:hypothetical protein HOC35_06845 [Candidatus Woesearchaeota archaeon]|nr:hypothetical protein [Candidatus Woesearchaeota archaeon]